MIVDEMDLVRQLKHTGNLRAEAYGRAEATLRAAMVEPAPAPVLEMDGVAPARRVRDSPRPGRRRTVGSLGRVGIGVGLAAVAAAVAVVFVATSRPQTAAPTGSASQPPAVESRLVSLAAAIMAGDGSLPGDASLVVRTQTIQNRPPYVNYNLYTDGGAYYVTDTRKQLPAAIAHHDNLADGTQAREVAAARYAASGDLATARDRMVDATPNPFGLGLSPAEQERVWDNAISAERRRILREKGITISPDRPTGKDLQNLINNYLWNNAVDALSAGAGSPVVRAGVLRLLSTIADVTVADSAVGGRPALTITAGPALFGGDLQQVLTIDATTGMPIRSLSGAPGRQPSSVVTFQVSRVRLADVAAGRF